MMKTALFLVCLVATTLALPTNFDSRQQWSQCKWQILNQQQCGSCWDFCSVESFADRLCITGEADAGTTISPEPILDCTHFGCNGANPAIAWNYLIKSGSTTCTEQCFAGCAPYDSGDGKTPLCHAPKCDDGSEWPVTYQGGHFHQLKPNDLQTFQNELYNNGPLQACFNVYNNFYTFFAANATGIYTEAADGLVGGHCVKLIGWGTTAGQDYWLLANSWDTTWADNGYFRMARGDNLCGIEAQVSEGLTKSQAVAKGLPFGVDPEYDTTFIVGGFHAHAEMDSYMVAAVEAGLSQVGKKLHRSLTLSEVVKAESQVVAGVNFDFEVKTVEGVVVAMKVHRSLEFEYELVEHSLVF